MAGPQFYGGPDLQKKTPGKAVEFLGKMLTLYTGRKNSGLPVVDRRRRINLPWDFNYSFLFLNLINFIVLPDAVVVTLPS